MNEDTIIQLFRQATEAASKKAGLGETVGRVIHESVFPHSDISIAAAAYRLNIPLTVHVSIGCDITHEHDNFDGAAYGLTSYIDFLIFAKVLESLEGGVIMNFGSAVMAPEIYLKALSMVRNIAQQEHKSVSNFTSLVCDLQQLPENIQHESSKNSPEYYFRPWKTMLVRTVSDGGEGYYIRGPHSETVPQLWTAITRRTGLIKSDLTIN